VVCGETHAYCVAARADVAEIALDWRRELLLAMALIAFYAIWPASVTHRALGRFWSLEHRFRRNLSKESVVCAYQPILDLRTGEISGCEVLARWRDVDGSIVPPDKFVEIVARSGQTLAFTRVVAERAFEELTRTLPQDIRLQVNFNIFPRDLDSEKLGEVFRSFESERDRFPLALEIVESDALAVDNAQREIEALARRGIRTYIDDFGSGYSSIHRVASLAIHGVKLDRSFAMAPSESLMARMLVHALDMVGSSGREIVVEGVETQDRLDLLIETKRVAHAQGYLISRPLSIERLAEFLAKHDAGAALTGGARAEAA
jgi:sensor c-di-GMP phosphodiesterase-like protein